jgi:hypothetical protein
MRTQPLSKSAIPMLVIVASCATVVGLAAHALSRGHGQPAAEIAKTGPQQAKAAAPASTKNPALDGALAADASWKQWRPLTDF